MEELQNEVREIARDKPSRVVWEVAMAFKAVPITFLSATIIIWIQLLYRESKYLANWLRYEAVVSIFRYNIQGS